MLYAAFLFYAFTLETVSNNSYFIFKNINYICVTIMYKNIKFVYFGVLVKKSYILHNIPYTSAAFCMQGMEIVECKLGQTLIRVDGDLLPFNPKQGGK